MSDKFKIEMQAAQELDLEKAQAETLKAIWEDEVDILEEELRNDKTWILSSRMLYRFNNGRDFVGDDAAAAQYGLEEMSTFNAAFTNLDPFSKDDSKGLLEYMASLSDATDSQKLAFGYLSEVYDHKDITGKGVWRGLKAMFQDPTNLASFGGPMAIAGKFAGRQAAKEGVRFFTRKLVQNLMSKRGAAIAAADGAVIMQQDDYQRQKLEAGIGGARETSFFQQGGEEVSPYSDSDPDIEFGRNALMSGTGALFGYGLTKGPAAVRAAVDAFSDVATRDPGGMVLRSGIDPEAGVAGVTAAAKSLLSDEPVTLINALKPVPMAKGIDEEIMGVRTSSAEAAKEARKGGIPLVSWLRTDATVTEPLGTKGGFVKEINNKNADGAYAALDNATARYPDAAASEESWAAYHADLLGKKAGQAIKVPAAPHNLIRYANNPDDLVSVMSHITPDQIKMAGDGLADTTRYGEMYAAGEVSEMDTGRLFLWGILSRMKSAYPQEAAFLDTIQHSDKAGNTIDTFIQKAIDGEYSAADQKAFLKWAKSALPKGSPGRMAVDNLNSFGRNTLPALSRMTDGETALARLHREISDPEISGQQIRRDFYKYAEKSGINNKVLSFMLLASGRRDVMVLDRIQFNHLWDDGRFGGHNLYTASTFLDESGAVRKTEANKPMSVGGSSIGAIGDNAVGLATYEAVEAQLNKILPDVYAKLGREYGGIGQWHWESWVLTSGQEVGHESLKHFSKRGVPAAREGRYDQTAYGARYTTGPEGPRITIPNSKGEEYSFDLASWDKYKTTLTQPKTGIIWKGFKLADFKESNKAWINDERTDKGKLDQLISELGEPVSGNEVASGAVKKGTSNRTGRGRK